MLTYFKPIRPRDGRPGRGDAERGRGGGRVERLHVELQLWQRATEARALRPDNDSNLRTCNRAEIVTLTNDVGSPVAPQWLTRFFDKKTI